MKDISEEFLRELDQRLSQYPDCDELLINGSRGVFVAGSTKTIKIEPFSQTTEQISDVMRFLAWKQGLRLDARSPSCGGIIEPSGLRWQALVSPVSQDEIVLSFRRHKFNDLNLESFAISTGHQHKIAAAIQEKRPILIVGATGVGKSTLLVSLLKKWHLSSRVIIIESVTELPTLSDTWIRLTESAAQVSGQGAFSLDRVARETLRLRPEVLIVGELRGAEAHVFLDLSLCGHSGCMTTIHGANPAMAMRRLNKMAEKTVASLPPDWRAIVIHVERIAGIATITDVTEEGFAHSD